MPQLDPTWFASQLFWLLASFVLLYFVLSRLVLPPLLGIIALRKETLESDLGTAQTMKTRAQEAKDQYERALAEARQRSQAVMNEATLAHKAQAEAAAKKLDGEIAAKLKEAETNIRKKKTELMEALTPAAAELSQAIVASLTRQDKNQAAAKPLAKGNRS